MSITLGLVIVTALASFQAFNNRKMFKSLMHHPYTEHREKQYYRLISSGFIHGSQNHLLINGFVLFMFGTSIEGKFTNSFGVMGPILFVVLYMTAIIAGNLPSFFKYKNNPNYSAIGASGATSALVLIYCLLDPWGWFVYPPVPAIVFAIGYLAYSHWADKTNKADGIGHSAHLYGAIWGLLFFVVAAPGELSTFATEFLKGPTIPGIFK